MGPLKVIKWLVQSGDDKSHCLIMGVGPSGPPIGPVVGIQLCCSEKAERLPTVLDCLDWVYPEDLEFPRGLASL
jgi:hypothetical protein